MRSQIDLDDLPGFSLADDLRIGSVGVSPHADAVAHVDNSGANKNRDFGVFAGHTAPGTGLPEHYFRREDVGLFFRPARRYGVFNQGIFRKVRLALVVRTDRSSTNTAVARQIFGYFDAASRHGNMQRHSVRGRLFKMVCNPSNLRRLAHVTHQRLTSSMKAALFGGVQSGLKTC